MAKFDYDIAVLGGGAAGLTVASGAGQLGARTLLLEKEPELGRRLPAFRVRAEQDPD